MYSSCWWKYAGPVAGVLLSCLASLGHAQNSLEQIQAALAGRTPNHVLVAAHRGDWRNAPENSLPGIRNCIVLGVDMVELDVRVTKDGRLVLMHDKTLDRTTTGSGLVKNYTLAQLQKLYLKDGLGVPTRHRIPTLEEALDACRGEVMVFIDKGYNVLPAVVAVVEQAGMLKQCLFEGTASCDTLRAQYPALVDKIRFMPRVQENDVNRRAFIEAYATRQPPAAYIFSIATVDAPAWDDIRWVQRNTHTPVLLATLWPETCAGHDDELALQDPDVTWGWTLAQGTNILCTDRPAAMIAYLRGKGVHP